jgi:cellulose synthase/poly-beta-1,6-N-acetylglucosamine synthase-like glycosyltransferase
VWGSPAVRRPPAASGRQPPRLRTSLGHFRSPCAARHDQRRHSRVQLRGLPREAIESARQQTRAPLEIVVVDDASSDASADVAAAAGACVYRMPANGGPSAARNLGIREARGDYVAMLDADDSWEPHHCATVAGLLDATRRGARVRAGTPPLPRERDTNVTVAADTR